jgi:hypothetical protein
MRTRLRLGAAASVGLGALLLATVLASPAFAWHSTVTVNSRCVEGGVRVHYSVEAWEKGHKATIDVSYELNGETVVLEDDTPLFNKFTDHFDLAAGTTGEIVFTVVTTWKDTGEETTSHGKDMLPKPEKCKGEESSTTTSESTTTSKSTTTTTAPTTTESTVAPTTSIEATTTTVAVGGATSTTAGGQLPFTGAGSTQPMLLAGIVLVGGGGLFLLLSRDRRTAR